MDQSETSTDSRIAYWRQRLAGKPPLLLLPTDRSRGGSTGTETIAVKALLDKTSRLFAL